MDFILNKKERQNKILEIKEKSSPISTGIKLPIRPNDRFHVYRIPLKYLVYNHLNDRFASKSREYKHQFGKELDAESQDSLLYIEKLIWESNISRNKDTLKDLVKNGQQKPGVITNDGRIIDGNRRASLMRKIYLSNEPDMQNVDKQRFYYFEAVILPGDISDEEMMMLETRIQMEEDEKVEYRAIEKYLKIDKLIQAGLAYESIAPMMSIKSGKEVEKKHKIYKLMVDYLEYIDAKETFSLIEKYEDHFINLHTVLDAYYAGAYSTNWNPSEFDIIELKQIAFNYIRKGHEGKDFRNLMGGRKDNKGLFSNKEVWIKFKNKHDSTIDEIDKVMDKKIENGLITSIEDRETEWKKCVTKKLNSIFDLGKEALSNRIKDNKPRVLLEGALDKINLIDINAFDNGSDKEIYELAKLIITKATEIKERFIKDVFKKG